MVAPGLLPGDRSNRSARAFTLLAPDAGVGAAAADEAGPEAERGVVLGGERRRFVVGWRRREGAAMSTGGGGAISCSVVVHADL